MKLWRQARKVKNNLALFCSRLQRYLFKFREHNNIGFFEMPALAAMCRQNWKTSSFKNV